MKSAVIYHSKSGHSKRIAEAVAVSLGVRAQSVSAKPALSGIGLLFVIGGIYAGKSDQKLLRFLSTLGKSQVKRAALITSGMGKRGQDMVRNVLYINGIEVVSDEYVLRGSFPFFCLGHPSTQEIEGAVAYAKKLSDGDAP